MKEYLTSNFKSLLLLVVVGSVLSCTKVNHSLGGSIIPDKDKLVVVQETLNDFIIHTESVDSVRVDEYTDAYLGSYVSTKLGRANLTYTTEIQTSLSATDIEFKDVSKYRIDTAYLSLYVLGAIGDIDKPLTVKLYELETNFRTLYNATYEEYAPEGYYDPFYSNFDYKEYIKDEPLVTFEIDVREAYATNNAITVQLPDEYVKRIISMKKDDYKDDKSFRAIHKGFAFVAERELTSGVILTINPNETFAYFELTDLEEEDEEKKQKAFTFDFAHLNNSELYNQVVTTIELEPEFANSTIGIPQNIINDSINSYDYSYIGSLTAAMTRIKFPADKLNKLKEQLVDSPSAAIIVTNATLEIPIYNTSIGSLNSSVSRIAAYYDYLEPRYMSDYDLLDPEFNINSFGGLLNRTFCIYEMNVTLFIQEILNNKSENTSLDFATTESTLFDNKMVKLANTKENPIKLNLTYSIAK